MKPRTLAILGILGAAVLLAGLVLGLGGGPARPEAEAGRLALPDLAPKLQGAARVEVVHGSQTLVVAKQGDRWGLPDRGGYPVQTDKLRSILTGLTELRLIEPRTSDPAQYARLGVDDPKASGTTANLLRVLDGTGKPVAELILGHRRVRTQGGLPEQIYVRFPGQAQSWLAEGRLAVDADPQLWFDRDVADIAMARVATVAVQRGANRLLFAKVDGKPALTEPAQHPALEDYRVEDVFRGLETLTFTDVQPEAKLVGSEVATSTYTVADGPVVTVRLNRSGDQLWLRLSATGKDAEPLQAKWAGWAFQVGQWKEKALAPAMEDLVATPPPAAPGAAPGAAAPVAPPVSPGAAPSVPPAAAPVPRPAAPPVPRPATPPR